ncbi:ABC transporter permease [Streptomyces sp. TG1A-8]|uniref:ABC transporter permease n=1 Tax=Streptomyces sp. TG1A-8 TaxID=3051385 RepID=UPI00265C54A8|nr:ABC transporter permease [Streptomyces sp. TG1A-8]MDO0925889.1 ABC transporter permease [Streptomyces sp. TG1A-8]
MGRYVLRRLLQMAPVFIGSTLLIFLMVNVMGDPVAGLCGERRCDPATAAQLEREFGLDRPVFPQQYLTYMGKVFTGDFGTAFNGQEVTELMGTAFPVTVRLTVVAVVLEIVIGITLGVVTGLGRGRPADTGVLLATLVVISVPTFVTGLLLQLLLGIEWQWTRPSVQDGTFGELIVPGLVLASVSLAYVTRLTRTSIAENKRSDYVRTAVAKGLPRHRVVTRHLLRNSLIPVLTFVGTDIGALMGGAIVTERIFNIHGVGYQLYQGILRQNTQTVVGFVTVLVLVFLAANLLVDLLYAVLDPRIRYA